MYELVEDKYNKYLDILQFIKQINQFNLLKKLILNENQTFMINNQALKTVVGKYRKIDDEVFNMTTEEKLEKKQISLIDYLKSRNENNNISDYDKVLYSHLADDLKEKITDMVKSNQTSNEVKLLPL